MAKVKRDGRRKKAVKGKGAVSKVRRPQRSMGPDRDLAMKGYERPTGTKMAIENAPLFAMYVVGTVIFYGLGWAFAVTYVVLVIFSLFWHMRFICSYCLAPAVGKCASGIGNASYFLFRRRPHRRFGRQFRINVMAQLPPFILPAVVGAYLLYMNFTNGLLVVVIVFCALAFIMVPLTSQRHACEDCPMSKQCPYAK